MIYGPREFYESNSPALRERREWVINSLLKYVCDSESAAIAGADAIMAFDHIIQGAYPLQAILDTVSKVTHVSKTEIIGPRQLKYIVTARFAFYYLARAHTMKSFPQIGKSCGGRDHSTVIHGCQVVEKNMRIYEPIIAAARSALDRRKMA